MDQTKRIAIAYSSRTLLFLGAYALLNVAGIAGVTEHLSRPSVWVYSGLVGLPIAGQIWATLVLIRDSDEFVAALMAKRFIVAMGIAIALFSAWGFAESYAQAPHAPGWLIYPLFWGVFALVSPFLRTSRR